MKKLLTLLVSALAALMPASGQEAAGGKWDGNVSMSAGSNFIEDMSTQKFSYSSGEFSAWGRYRTDKFMVRLDLQGLSRFAASTTMGCTVNVRDLSAPQLNLDVNQNENTIFEEKAGLQMEFKPDLQNTFSLNFRQKLNKQTPNRVVISMVNTFEGDDYENVDTRYSFDIEEGIQDVTDYNLEANWHHKFDKPGREINSRIEWSLNRNDKSSTWYKFSLGYMMPEREWEEYMTAEEFTDEIGELDFVTESGEAAEDMSEQIYRITPLNMRNVLNASVAYRDRDLFDLKSLNLELGADFRAGYDRDRLSAANFIDEVWVDSTKYRENFDYFAMTVAPRAKLSYSPGQFNVNMQLSPDFYLSELNSDQKRGGVSFGKVYFLPDMSASWTPSQMHKVGISYRQGIVRPSYLQVCWFQRFGSYANEIQMGNPDLKPSSNGRTTLFYTFHSGFFTGTLEGIRAMDWDKIERVFNTVDEIRVYTWINSGYSTNNSLKLTLKADCKNFNAELGGYYNYYLGYNNSGNATQNADWGVNGNATLRLKGGWVFNVKGRYHSKIIRTYSSITEYIGCDARVTKDFRKFSVFVEGRDLFDQIIQVSTFSEDQAYARIEENYYNRRIFSIGASFNF